MSEPKEEEEDWISVIKPDPHQKVNDGSLDPEITKKALFTERVIPVKDRFVTSPSVHSPKKPLDPALQKMKNNLKSMIFEAWNELED